LETRDTADLEIGATPEVQNSTAPIPRVFLRLPGGRIVGSCAHSRAMADQCATARKNFSVMGVTECLLSEIANIGFG
jgi:hypothetical protein